MSGKLTEVQMDQLEHWIGTGPKKFDLLYAITRDSCDSNVFHQTCDNQGPTVTVLYNPHNSLYGGYSQVSWDTTSSWKSDSKAFLFRLQYNGLAAPYKFPHKGGNTDVYCDPSWGPMQNDLRTFFGVIKKTDGYFPLNGNMNLNNSYDSQGITKDQINNGTMNVTELEVYRVIGM